MRPSLNYLAFVLLWMIFAGNAISQPLKKENKRPNFIIILADDLGYGETGCYGQKIIRTPHIDKLAEQGITYIQKVAAAESATDQTALFGGFSLVST